MGCAQLLWSLAVGIFDHIVREVNDELSEAAFCGSVVAKDGLEGTVP